MKPKKSKILVKIWVVGPRNFSKSEKNFFAQNIIEWAETCNQKSRNVWLKFGVLDRKASLPHTVQRQKQARLSCTSVHNSSDKFTILNTDIILVCSCMFINVFFFFFSNSKCDEHGRHFFVFYAIPKDVHKLL